MDTEADKDRAYFARIARAAAGLQWDAPPSSLAEMFERMERIRELHGGLAEAGVDMDPDGDLASHQAFLARLRRHRDGALTGDDGP
ncbi:MAG: hypothetical protein JJU22_15395 [Gammaproteobacteria bacterium]|nr:hypothetical protein [Gammaproteobacteria bacterium]